MKRILSIVAMMVAGIALSVAQQKAKGSESVSWNDIQVGQTSLLSHWTLPAGSKQRVYVFTNASQAELFLNGKSLGVKTNDGKGNMQHVITWDVDYQPGTILAIARNNEGKEVARHDLQTAGKAVKLKITPSLFPEGNTIEVPSGAVWGTSWKADGMDLQYLNIFAVDNKGRIVPDYDNELSVSVEGAATLLALDNGDHYTNDLFAGIAKKKMRDGKMLVILRSKREAGKVQVNAVSGKFKTNYKTNTK